MKTYFAVIAATALLAPGAAFAQDMAPPPVSDLHDFSGARIEARLGYETPTVSDDGDVYKIGSAVSYGGELGFDIRAGNRVVVGPYANYELSSVELCDGSDCVKEKGNFNVGGRLGYIAGPNVLIYGKVGYANIAFKAESASLGSASEDKGGVQGGLGVELGFGRSAYGFLEGSYADYGKFYGINLQRRHVAGGVGIRF